MSIDPLLIKEASDQLDLPGVSEFRNLWTFQDEQLRRLILEMRHEMSTGWELSSLYGDLLCNPLVIALIKKYGKTPPHSAPFEGGLFVQNLDECCHTSMRISLGISACASSPALQD